MNAGFSYLADLDEYPPLDAAACSALQGQALHQLAGPTIIGSAAAYRGVKGDFLDFWDAFLWLVAFIFIEMNVSQWHGASRVPRISPPAPDGDRESRASPVR